MRGCVGGVKDLELSLVGVELEMGIGMNGNARTTIV